jgi:hypothetical protein
MRYASRSAYALPPWAARRRRARQLGPRSRARRVRLCGVCAQTLGRALFLTTALSNGPVSCGASHGSAVAAAAYSCALPTSSPCPHPCLAPWTHMFLVLHSATQNVAPYAQRVTTPVVHFPPSLMAPIVGFESMGRLRRKQSSRPHTCALRMQHVSIIWRGVKGGSSTSQGGKGKGSQQTKQANKPGTLSIAGGAWLLVWRQGVGQSLDMRQECFQPHMHLHAHMQDTGQAAR